MINKKNKVVAVVTILTFIIVCMLYKRLLVPREFSPLLENHPLLYRSYKMMWCWTVIFVAFFIYALFLIYDIQTPYTAILIIGSLLWSITAYHNDFIHSVGSLTHQSNVEMIFIYLSVITFNIAFCADVNIFNKTLPLSLMIGIVGGFRALESCDYTLVSVEMTAAILYGLIANLSLESTFDVRLGLFLGVTILPLYPQNVTSMLRQQTIQTRQISVVLDGDALITLLLGDIFYKIVLGYERGYLNNWYQFIIVLVRIVVFGLLTGLVMGYFGRFMLRKMCINPLNTLLVCFAVPLLTYSIAEIYTSGCGVVAMIPVGMMLGLERTYLPKNVNKLLIGFWDMIAFMSNTLVTVVCLIFCAVHILPLMTWKKYAAVLVLYFICYAVRLFCFLIFLPILRKIGFGITLKDTIVYVCGGIKGPISLLYLHRFHQQDVARDIVQIIYYYAAGVFVFSTLINSTFMRTVLGFMKLREISFAKNSNMTSCMEYILARQKRAVANLKLNRFFTDINWRYVINITTMKHPYTTKMDKDENDTYVESHRVTWCEECHKDILQQPTAQQIMDIKREVQRRTLKARKMSYSRQYENGTMSKHVAQILNQAVDYAIDSDTPVIKIEEMVRNLYEENALKRFLKRLGDMITKKREQKMHKKPRTYWRRVCFHIVLGNTLFEKIMLVVVLIHCVLILVSTYLYTPDEMRPHMIALDYFLFITKMIFCVMYFIEFVMKVMAYSWINICSHGFRRYFSSFWNFTDFIAMIASFARVMNKFIPIALKHRYNTKIVYNHILDLLGFSRFIRLLRVFDIFYPDFIACLNRRGDADTAFTFEFVKCYAYGEKEVLEMLPRMIQHASARQEMKDFIENQWEVLNTLLRKVQKEKPWIAITVKTTQAIRMVLQNMSEAIKQLKLSGWVDTIEYDKLSQSLSALYKEVNLIKRVDPSPPKIIFKEVPWMADDQAVIEFLFDNVAVKTYDDGDVIIAEGSVVDGIYIIVTGLVTLSYTPNPSMIQRLKHFGELPIVDYVVGVQYEQPYLEHIISGNCIGELGTLTQRPYNCTITSNGYSQIYFLSVPVLRRAMELMSDSALRLENRIWKEISVRIAEYLLPQIPEYQNSGNSIKFALERAFVPDLAKFKIFAVSEMIESIVLIEGIVVDFNTKEKYVAPCCIPRTVQKLILPKSSLMSVPVELQTTLLIIPIRNVDEYDVLVLAEETFELVDKRKSQCLLHTIRNRRDRAVTSSGSSIINRKLLNRTRAPRVSTDSFGSLFTDTLSWYSRDDDELMIEKGAELEKMDHDMTKPRFFS